MSMDKNDRNTIVTLATLLPILVALGGGILWLGSSIATLNAGVENNAKAIAELRADIKEIRTDIQEMREDLAELRGVVYSHIGGHTHAAADIAPDGVVSPESVTPSE